MKDNITLKKQESFNKSVIDGLVELGAVIQPTDERMLRNTQLKLDTIAGVLNITIFHTQRFLYSVYSKFEDVEKAKKLFNCNPHSGKYNFNASAKGNTAKYAIEGAMMHFECTQPKELA